MNKQIEEMAKETCKRRFGHTEPLCKTCDNLCLYIELSKIAYEANYRKASDVLREVEELGDLYQMPDGMGLVIKIKDFAELKKKYESEGAE